MNEKQQRNELCACGSKKKYKKCCGLKQAAAKQHHLQFFNPAAVKNSVASLKKHAFKVVSSPIMKKDGQELLP